MLRLSDKIEQDFLNKEWIQKFVDSGVPMGDNKYWIIDIDGTEYVSEDKSLAEQMNYPFTPTYTLSELQYKLIEWHPEYKALIFWKDAPFYFAQYQKAPDSTPYVCYSEYPIYAAAQLVINCVKDGFGVVKDISDKR